MVEKTINTTSTITDYLLVDNRKKCLIEKFSAICGRLTPLRYQFTYPASVSSNAAAATAAVSVRRILAPKSRAVKPF